ncbi:TRAP transporter small permease [Simiduia curdlanivorans]|nr:TRAP transporter small permease [Simiduia curdlanivorans]MDN3637555.1 TRAP transporter small permease [Simiduia curdlanivorans]
MTAIVLDVSWQVITRFVMTKPSSFTEELAGFLLIWIGILGAAYAFRLKAHLGLDLVTAKLTGRRAQVIEIIGWAVCFLFSAAVMVYGGLRLVLLTLELNQVSAALGVKMGYVYCAVPLSGLLICLYSLVFIAEAFGHRQSQPT